MKINLRPFKTCVGTLQNGPGEKCVSQTFIKEVLDMGEKVKAMEGSVRVSEGQCRPQVDCNPTPHPIIPSHRHLPPPSHTKTMDQSKTWALPLRLFNVHNYI